MSNGHLPYNVLDAWCGMWICVHSKIDAQKQLAETSLSQYVFCAGCTCPKIFCIMDNNLLSAFWQYFLNTFQFCTCFEWTLCTWTVLGYLGGVCTFLRVSGHTENRTTILEQGNLSTKEQDIWWNLDAWQVVNLRLAEMLRSSFVWKSKTETWSNLIILDSETERNTQKSNRSSQIKEFNLRFWDLIKHFWDPEVSRYLTTCHYSVHCRPRKQQFKLIGSAKSASQQAMWVNWSGRSSTFHQET